MGIKRIVQALVCIPLLTASTAWSAEIHGRSSTQFLWFNDAATDNKQAEFAQYLNLSITNIDKEGKFSIQGYGRGTQDVRNGQGLNGRLYYLYGDYRDLLDKVDIRLGRQFVNYAAGSALIDGGQIQLKNIGPVALSVMGGRNVIFDLDGEATKSNDFAFGVAANLAGYKNTDAEVSYFMKFDKDGVARDNLGVSFKQYLFDMFKIYANTRFDFASEVFSEVLAGIKYFPTSNLVFTGEWYQSYPTFDSTSIYSVFAVNRYQEGVFRADYAINDKISVNAGYTYEDYDGEDANVVEVGCRLRPIEMVQLNLNYDHRSGYGGDLDGGMAELIVTPIKPVELSAGIHYDVYERDKTTGNETARKYWFGGKCRLTKNMSASVRAEDNVNENYHSDWQGRLVFNYDF